MKRIIQITTLFIVGLCVGAMLAQQPKPTVKPAPVAANHPPPAIPETMQKDFWKAQAQMTNAEANLRSAQQAAQQAVQEIQRACGADFQPQSDAKGDPVCVPKPAPPPK